MTEKQFIETYCYPCGTQRCEGPGSEWFEGCRKRWNLDGIDAAAEIERLNNKVMELATKLVNSEPVRHGEWIPIVNYRSEKPDDRYCCSVCHRVETMKGIYCRLCGAKMDGGKE